MRQMIPKLWNCQMKGEGKYSRGICRDVDKKPIFRMAQLAYKTMQKLHKNKACNSTYVKRVYGTPLPVPM